MIQQIKKILLSFFIVVGIFSAAISLPVYAYYCASAEGVTEISEVVEQKSIIDEQARIFIIVKETINNFWEEEEPLLPPKVEPIPPQEEEVNEDFLSIVRETKEEEHLNPYKELIDSFNEYEKNLIYQITYAEAGNQELEGQRAVIEVILNRILSDKYPSTVEGVLSESGQFTTWELRNKVEHNEKQIEALKLVKENKPILDKEYLIFSKGKFSWGKNYIKIQDHWFGTF